MVKEIIKKSGHVTVQTKLYKNNQLFTPNMQLPFDQIVIEERGCGCSGQKKKDVRMYRVQLNDRNFLLDSPYVVETNTPIPKESQDFDVARRDQHRNPGTDFSDIVSHPEPIKIWNYALEQARDNFKH